MEVKDSVQVQLIKFQNKLKDYESNHEKNNFDILLSLFDSLLNLAEKNYTLNRRIVQNLIGYLTESIHIGKDLLLYRIQSRFFIRQEYLYITETPDYMIDIPENKEGLIFVYYNKILEYFPKKIDITQISEMAVAHLNEDELKWLQTFCGRYIANHGTYLNMSEQDVFNCSMAIAIIRSLSLKNNHREYFFLTMTQLVACLSKSHYYQEARDFAESAIMMSFDDELEEYGFLVATRAYTSNNDAIAGLVYYNMLMDIIHKKKSVTKKFLFEMLWQQIMTLRTASYFEQDYYIELSNFFDKQNFNAYDYDSFHHSLFTIDLLAKRKDLPLKISTYLHRRLKEIEIQGEHGIIPWFLSLLQMFQIYDKEEMKPLERYLETLDNAIPDKTRLQGYINTILKQNLSQQLKEEVIRLSSTRYLHNFNTDSWFVSLLAHNLLDEAYRKKNFADFVMAMIFRSDYGFIFPEREYCNLKAPVTPSKAKSDDLHVLYESIDGIRAGIQTFGSDEMLWIGNGANSVYGFSMVRDAYSFEDYGRWDLEQLRKAKLFEPFTIQTKDIHGSPINKVEEDFKEEYNELYVQMLPFKIAVSSDQCNICLAKDKDLAFVPHQLLIDKISGQFLGELKPSTNVLSTEIMVTSLLDKMLNTNYSKSFWCPIGEEPGINDFALQMQYEKLKDWLNQSNFIIFNQTYPEKALNSEVNVICAHGGSEISNEQCFYVNNKPIRDIDRIIGKGKLLILLTCHSGSMKENGGYDSSIHSFIKKFIREEYACIVAPMWSLSVDITLPWMQKFFQELDNGKFVCEAVFQANMHIKSMYISPYAWACMHLFGNPYLMVDKG